MMEIEKRFLEHSSTLPFSPYIIIFSIISTGIYTLQLLQHQLKEIDFISY